MNLPVFESIRRVNEHSAEFWSARDLMAPLGYLRWENFQVAVRRAKESCVAFGQSSADHFRDVTKMVGIGSGAGRETDDCHLSRYACYLIAQNGDPRKPQIAAAQSYFAIQTRRQEAQDALAEDSKRVVLRGEMGARNKKLAQAAKASGVTNYAGFQDYGYMGLYGGLRQKDIHARKKLAPKEAILDHMGGEELAANLFRATQAEARLRREAAFGQAAADKAHFEVGKKVRSTIKELGGTMPEDLPAADDIRAAKRRLKSGGKGRAIGGVG